MTCSGCKTYVYCDIGHQRADWDKHKDFCNEVRLEASLTIAAKVVQQAWLTLKEHTWAIPISRIELENQEVVAYEDSTATNTLFSNFADIPYPDQAAKHALLCFPYPFLPLALMQPLITLLIKPSKFHFHEVQVELKEAQRTVALADQDNKRDTNWPTHSLMLLRVTNTRNSKRWYINPSGAEFGLTQEIFTAEEFHSVHLRRLCKVINFGKCREFTQACARIERSSSYYTRIDLNAAWRMRTALSDFLQQPGNALANIVCKNDADSLAWKRSLMNVLTQAVRGYVSNYNPREFLHAKHHETDQTVREGAVQEWILHDILVDVRTAEERADHPAPETNEAQAMAQLRDQIHGSELDLVLEVKQSMSLM